MRNCLSTLTVCAYSVLPINGADVPYLNRAQFKRVGENPYWCTCRRLVYFRKGSEWYPQGRAIDRWIRDDGKDHVYIDRGCNPQWAMVQLNDSDPSREYLYNRARNVPCNRSERCDGGMFHSATGTKSVAVRQKDTKSVAVPATGTKSVAVHQKGSKSVAVPAAGTKSVAVRQKGTKSVAVPAAGTKSVAVPATGTNPGVVRAQDNKRGVVPAQDNKRGVVRAQGNKRAARRG